MKYHLIGIKGVSMSALAEILSSMGHIVTGSDIKIDGHPRSNITADIDVVVRTSAVNPGSLGWIEVEEAKKQNIRVIKRSELISQISKNKKLIAVSGMHGKTTTTTLISLMMINAGFDPTVLIGEKVHELGDRSYRIGKSDYLILEACEYDRSFLDFHPDYLVLTNIDEEHLDTYPGGIVEIKSAFKKYINNVKHNGVIVANKRDCEVVDVLKSVRNDIKIIWYGETENLKSWDISIRGEHNRQNISGALALCQELGVPISSIKDVLKSFKGAKRRMEYWGKYNNALLFDDYGHHPTEIRATIKALKDDFPAKKIIVIFWPHQYKRILPLANDFSDSLFCADKVYIKEIFFVEGRDHKLPISSKDLVEKINLKDKKAVAFTNDEDIIQDVMELSKDDCVILTLGIPPIYKILEKLTT